MLIHVICVAMQWAIAFNWKSAEVTFLQVISRLDVIMFLRGKYFILPKPHFDYK